jgi:hypothetical protein
MGGSIVGDGVNNGKMLGLLGLAGEMLGVVGLVLGKELGDPIGEALGLGLDGVGTGMAD